MNWEWLETEPTSEDVTKALDSLKPVHGVKTVDYIEHVLPMFAWQKQYEDRDGLRTTYKRQQAKEVFVPSWKLYMQVAGRVAMVNDAGVLNKWRVDFTPDPNMEDGKVSYGAGGKAVYREFVEIYEREQVADSRMLDGAGGVTGLDWRTSGWRLLGRRPGMAALKSGGNVPAFEKMETAARGRALGAWGFGVLPGSGIASADEMELASYADVVLSSDEPADLKERSEIESETLTFLEQYRQMRNRTDDEAWEWLRATAFSAFQIALDKDERDLSPLSDAQAELLRRRVESEVRRLTGVNDL